MQANFKVRRWDNGRVVEEKEFQYLTEAQAYEAELKREHGFIARVEIINLTTGHPM